MRLPLDIRFRNLHPTPVMKEDIRRRADKLNGYCGDLSSCHVLVEVPHRHHERGNRFHVRIDLTAPGAEIAVTRESTLRASVKGEKAHAKAQEIDAMRTHLGLVVREAFDVARRRLQDYARRRRGAVKSHRPSRRVRQLTQPRDVALIGGEARGALQESR